MSHEASSTGFLAICDVPLCFPNFRYRLTIVEQSNKWCAASNFQGPGGKNSVKTVCSSAEIQTWYTWNDLVHPSEMSPHSRPPAIDANFHQVLPLTWMVAVTSGSCTGGVTTFSGNKIRITPLYVHRLPSTLALLLSTHWSTSGWWLNNDKCKVTANSEELYYSPSRYNVASIALGSTAQNSNRAPPVPRVPSSGISNNSFRLLRVVRQQDSLLWWANYLFLRDT